MIDGEMTTDVRAGAGGPGGAVRPGWIFWLATVLLFVFSLPHVMALRNLLLLGLLVLVARHFAQLGELVRNPVSRIAVAALLALLGWMLCVSLFLAPAPVDSLRAFVGDWLRALVAVLAGCGVAFALRKQSEALVPSLVAAIIVIAAMGHMIGHDIAASMRWIERGDLPARFPGITDHRANVTHVFALLISVIGADLVSRHVAGRPLLRLGGFAISGLMLLGFFAMLTSSTTNGWIVAMLSVLLIMGLLLGMRRADGTQSRKQRNILIALGLGFVVLGSVAVVKDPRYEGFVETVAIGWDTESNRQWLDAEHTDQWPVRANGEAVDPSTYSRVAWAKEGIELLLEHPFGTEISKHTYERLIRDKYGVAYMSHSHVGLIDFGLNVGFPGIALWLLFLGALIWLGIGTTRRTGNFVGFALAFVVLTFTLRMLLDSTLRDHILEQFMFCVGMLAAACIGARSTAADRP
jgi:O-antigen ligase